MALRKQPAIPGKPILLAHRGMAQNVRREGLTSETYTATRIHVTELSRVCELMMLLSGWSAHQ